MLETISFLIISSPSKFIQKRNISLLIFIQFNNNFTIRLKGILGILKVKNEAEATELAEFI